MSFSVTLQAHSSAGGTVKEIAAVQSAVQNVINEARKNGLQITIAKVLPDK